jgi:hypothetical protein
LSGSVTLENQKARAGGTAPAPKGWLAGHKLLAGVVAAVLLVGAGVTGFLLLRGSSDSSPPHTPVLGLQVWQVQKADAVSTADGHSTVKLAPGPFQLRFPVVPIDNGPRICAWTDKSIFTFQAGQTMDQVTCLKPGSVLPTPSVGASDLLLATDGHNNLVGDRLVAVEGGYDQVGFTSLTRNGQDAPLGWTTDVYLAVYIDKNKNNAIDKGEYEFVVLDF